MAEIINSFQGKYRFLSNFYPARVCAQDGLFYPSVENAYQAQKTDDPEHKAHLQIVPAAQAKRFGRLVALKKDWEGQKLTVMRFLLEEKFSDEDLAKKLLDTGDSQLVDGNDWGDYFWGVCKGAGSNHLGELLMEIRQQLRV